VAFVLPNSIFIHIPKTGGQWVVSALERTGVPVGSLGVVHTSPDEIAETPEFKDREFIFAMVRHPLTWYQSMWAHQMDDKWEPIDARDWFTPRWLEFWANFTKHCSSSRFQEFVENCLDVYPDGLVSTLYEAYTKECVFVGKQERLIGDLLEAMKIAGEKFDETRLVGAAARNVRGGLAHRQRACAYTTELVDRVMLVERRAIQQFGYDQVPESIEAKLKI
jgi:hypothetical protein